MRAVSVTFEIERKPRATDTQILHPERAQKGGQVRIDNSQLAAVGARLHSQQAGEQQEGCSPSNLRK
jgi:hypothetical protein